MTERDRQRTPDAAAALLSGRPTEAPPDAAAGACLARVVSILGDGTPLVKIDDNTPVVPARLALRTTRERVETAIAERQEVVVVFENGDRSKPLILGFIETLPPANDTSEASSNTPVVEADVDGRRVRVTAQDEIVLQCGSASVTLRRNGRVIIRGTYVETHSEGTNRIKGGQVQIN
jgi:hypothetical protein